MASAGDGKASVQVTWNLNNQREQCEQSSTDHHQTCKRVLEGMLSEGSPPSLRGEGAAGLKPQATLNPPRALYMRTLYVCTSCTSVPVHGCATSIPHPQLGILGGWETVEVGPRPCSPTATEVQSVTVKLPSLKTEPLCQQGKYRQSISQQ